MSLFSEGPQLVSSLKEDEAPDVLLMDWHIGIDDTDENALGLLKKIRTCKPSMPILMLSCSAELQDMVAAIRMGATDVILKPFRKERHRRCRRSVPQELGEADRRS